jgi:RNA polymerase sigma factor (sigma-70 family)
MVLSTVMPREADSMQSPQDWSHDPSRAEFATTQWSLVVRASDRRSDEGAAALEELCQRYWYPLYVYVRRRVRDVHVAQDVTQSFFMHLLEQQALQRATCERGRFRNFLLASVRNFLVNESKRAQARKRGGACRHLSFDFSEGESRLEQPPAHECTPERLYERQWALTILEQVALRLRSEFDAAGKLRQYELLRSALSPDDTLIRYGDAAAELGVSGEAVRQIVHRLRKRYRELLREEVGRTVETPAEIEDEIRSLFEALET